MTKKQKQLKKEANRILEELHIENPTEEQIEQEIQDIIQQQDEVSIEEYEAGIMDTIDAKFTPFDDDGL